jgi:hypothetical protein
MFFKLIVGKENIANMRKESDVLISGDALFRINCVSRTTVNPFLIIKQTLNPSVTIRY